MNTAVIGLGSNIKPQENISKAKKQLARDFKILSQSRFMTTKPLGMPDQADFLNGAILLETDLEAEELKTHLRKTEAALGRKHTGKHFGPRTIDLDLLVWNGQVVNKDFYERDFVQTSVLELLPQLKG